VFLLHVSFICLFCRSLLHVSPKVIHIGLVYRSLVCVSLNVSFIGLFDRSLLYVSHIGHSYTTRV